MRHCSISRRSIRWPKVLRWRHRSFLELTCRARLRLVRAEGAPLISGDDVLTLQGLAEQLAVGLELAKAHDQREQLMLVGDRERIARNLHDDVIQQLFGMGLRLQNLAGLSSDRRVTDGIAEVVDELDATIGRLRSVVFELETTQSEQPSGWYAKRRPAGAGRRSAGGKFRPAAVWSDAVLQPAPHGTHGPSRGWPRLRAPRRHRRLPVRGR